MTTPLRISRRGLELIAAFEGFLPDAQRRADGRWAVGFGHSASARPDAHVSREEAFLLLRYDLRPIEEAIAANVRTPLTQNQIDALGAFAFNIGLSAFLNSDVCAHLNAGRPLAAADAFEAWRCAKIGGRVMVVDALVRRRAAEKALFLDLPEGPMPAPSLDLRPLAAAEEPALASDCAPAPAPDVEPAPHSVAESDADRAPEPEHGRALPPPPPFDAVARILPSAFYAAAPAAEAPAPHVAEIVTVTETAEGAAIPAPSAIAAEPEAAAEAPAPSLILTLSPELTSDLARLTADSAREPVQEPAPAAPAPLAPEAAVIPPPPAAALLAEVPASAPSADPAPPPPIGIVDDTVPWTGQVDVTPPARPQSLFAPVVLAVAGLGAAAFGVSQLWIDRTIEIPHVERAGWMTLAVAGGLALAVGLYTGLRRAGIGGRG